MNNGDICHAAPSASRGGLPSQEKSWGQLLRVRRKKGRCGDSVSTCPRGCPPTTVTDVRFLPGGDGPGEGLR